MKTILEPLVFKDIFTADTLRAIYADHALQKVLAFGRESHIVCHFIGAIFNLSKYLRSILSITIERVRASYKKVEKDTH